MLILASETDVAARNIRDHLLTLWDHQEEGSFRGHPILRSSSKKVYLATIPEHALEFDNPHISIFPASKDGFDPFPDPDVIMYLSRHQSVSGKKTLSVHPIGNFSEAKFGGRERTVIPTSPHIMTHAFRLLSARVPEGYECTFEATHHGPYNDVPSFFIEIGSNVEEWNDPVAIEALTLSVHQLIQDYETDQIPKGPVCIGLGGGHYCPRHSKFALGEGLDFGHIIPAYSRKSLNRELAKQIIEKTPGVERICVHGKKHRKESRIFSKLGIEVAEY